MTSDASPLEVGRKRVKISHLQFADDTFLFGQASEKNVKVLKSILRCFEFWFGSENKFQEKQSFWDSRGG